MKEKVKEIMGTLGFQLTELDEDVYMFDYEGLHYLLLFNSNDDDFVQFSVPCLVERGDIPDDKFVELINRFNYDFKYVKCYEIHNHLSLFYERDLSDVSDLESVVEHSIKWLAVGAAHAQIAIGVAKKEADSASDSSAEESA